MPFSLRFSFFLMGFVRKRQRVHYLPRLLFVPLGAGKNDCRKPRHDMSFQKGKWGRKREFKVSLKTRTPGSTHVVVCGRAAAAAAAAKANFSSLLRTSIRFESGLHSYGSWEGRGGRGEGEALGPKVELWVGGRRVGKGAFVWWWGRWVGARRQRGGCLVAKSITG